MKLKLCSVQKNLQIWQYIGNGQRHKHSSLYSLSNLPMAVEIQDWHHMQQTITSGSWMLFNLCKYYNTSALLTCQAPDTPKEVTNVYIYISGVSQSSSVTTRGNPNKISKWNFNDRWDGDASCWDHLKQWKQLTVFLELIHLQYDATCWDGRSWLFFVTNPF